MAGPGRGIPGRASGPCGAAGASRIFPETAAGKLILGRKRWRDGSTRRGRAAGFGVFCDSLSSLLLVPAPGTGSCCCSRPDPCFPAPLWSPTSPFSGVGAASRRRRERWGPGEDCAGPAGVRWAQGHASRAPRSGCRRDPAPSWVRAAAREPVPVRSGRPPSTLGDERGGLRYAAAASPFWRMILGEETQARTPRVPRPAARVGAAWSRAWAASAPSTVRVPRRRSLCPAGRVRPGRFGEKRTFCSLIRAVPALKPSHHPWLIFLL